MKIKVIDSIMGSGKTSWAINEMDKNTDKNYIYITPYLTEVERVKKSVANKRFYEPKNFGTGKQDSLHELILKNKNIVSTHSLFKMSNETTKKLLKASNYTLILDEVMDVLEEVKLKRDDVDLLLENNIISIKEDENNLVIWNEDKMELDTQYNTLKQMCINKNVFMINNVLLMWTFPVSIFESFNEVYLLTYLFKGQVQRYYYDLYKIDYGYYSINKNENGEYYICDYIKQYDMSGIKNKIDVLIDDKLNAIGDDKFDLSKSWFDKPSNRHLVEKLKDNMYNYFRHKTNGKSKENMWTTFKNKESKLRGKGYTKGFVTLNCRATNDYCNKCNIAYCANRFLNPIIKQFFTDRGVNVDEDTFALSEMLQWIWRSRIRQKESINIYVPSKRMRNLLLDWLNGKEIK